MRALSISRSPSSLWFGPCLRHRSTAHLGMFPIDISGCPYACGVGCPIREERRADRFDIADCADCAATCVRGRVVCRRRTSTARTTWTWASRSTGCRQPPMEMGLILDNRRHRRGPPANAPPTRRHRPASPGQESRGPPPTSQHCSLPRNHARAVARATPRACRHGRQRPALWAEASQSLRRSSPSNRRNRRNRGKTASSCPGSDWGWQFRHMYWFVTSVVNAIQASLVPLPVSWFHPTTVNVMNVSSPPPPTCRAGRIRADLRAPITILVVLSPGYNRGTARF